MSAPWKSDPTTLDKIEETVVDFLDKLNIEEHLNDWKDQIASSDAADLVRDKLPGVAPTKKSHTKRNLLILAALGAGTAAIIAARKRSAAPPAAATRYVPAS